MDFYCSMSDSKTFKVARTRLSILADFNCDVICIVFFFHLISSLFPRPLKAVFKGSNYNWYHSDFNVPQFFFNLKFFGKIQLFVKLFAVFDYHSIVHWNGKNRKNTSSFFSC